MSFEIISTQRQFLLGCTTHSRHWEILFLANNCLKLFALLKTFHRFLNFSTYVRQLGSVRPLNIVAEDAHDKFVLVNNSIWFCVPYLRGILSNLNVQCAGLF